MESTPASIVDAVLAAPIGAAVLGVLEGDESGPVGWANLPQGTDPEGVQRAVSGVADLTFGQLAFLLTEVGAWTAGPWMPEAPEMVALAYRDAPARRAIAEALVDGFVTALVDPLDPGRQEWWTSAPEGREVPPAFADLGPVYGQGEFPWNGIWTVTDPPREAHRALAGAWEVYPEPVSRWRLPASGAARVWEIYGPEDWVALVERFPNAATAPHGGWELPGPNQHLPHDHPLFALPTQHAARRSIARHVLPDWTAVAREYDAVHLSWLGFLTSEGFVSDLGGGDVTMLRYWSSERTMWLNDVFGEPEPLGAPSMDENGIDVRTAEARRASDRDHLRALLQR